ncbi:hypothetical protein N431DRAFT_483390 [Stipitochalara longipes BDJ]|nr:hypothetical protein N431DRAFT_483390 [Stipitochalara longipes BDJ]
MSDSSRSTLHDPRYGSVRQLCRALGYAAEGGEHRKAPRSISFLRSKAAKYRKQFVDNCAGLERFPLEFQSPEVQQCVSEFLIENPRVFDDSDQAREFGWPVYPRDCERLIDGLAKLMCTQEYLRRRNVQTASTRQKRALEESEDSSLDDSDSEQSEIIERYSDVWFMGPALEERNAINFEKARENIEIHLDFIYPLDGTEEERASSWLFNKDNWPKDSKRFSWRYFHEHNLYSNRKVNTEALILFTETLKCHLDVECTKTGDAVVRKRCARQVTYSAGMWRKYGFLEEIHGVLRKTVQFEDAWRQRRQLWIDLVHKGNPPVVPKLQRSAASLPGASETGAGSKRAHVYVEDVYDIYDVPSDEASSSLAAKRSKVKGFENNYSGSHSNDREGRTFDTGLGGDEATISVDTEVIREPRRIPEAPMLTSNLGQPQSSAKAAQAEHAQNKRTARQPSPSGHNFSRINQSPDPLSLAGSSVRKDTKLNGELDLQQPFEKRSSPYALSGVSLNIPFSTDTALVKVARTAPPAKPTKPQLHYILPKPTGGLDHDVPLPRADFIDSKLSEFFKTVARKAGKPDESCSCLTFTYNWGGREAFVVKRYGGDQYWEEIKERVKGTFLKARNSMPKRTARFELWVECGDTTNMDEVEEEEDW